MARYSNYGLTLLTLFSLSAFAGPTSLECTSTLSENANDLLKLADKIEPECKQVITNASRFCGDIGTKLPANDPNGFYEYSYQKLMYEGACVDIEKMSEKEINSKLKEWWNLNKSKLVCDTLQFGVTNGSVLKYAAKSNTWSFIDEAISAGFDLNFVDKSDNRTVLDYVKDELVKRKGTSLEKELQETYTKLQKAGAKHKSEL